MPNDKELKESKEEEDSYVWDNDTQLYIHHSSGFYHDPNAGWYYCSKDGHYYKYENGEYVLLEYDVNPSRENATCDSSEGRKDDSFAQTDDEYGVSLSNPGEASVGCSNDQESEHAQRPSSWVEDALNELYQADLEHSSCYETASVVDNRDYGMLSANGEDDAEELEEGEWIPEEDFDPQEHNFDEGVYLAAFSREEALWQAQFGQVIESPENPLPEIPAIDLWEWKFICESGKADNEPVARLVGRLVKRSANLHPSVASGGKLFKTSPICEAQNHLVRVRTGQVYKLQNPSAKYLASLPAYDYSNPTKDWGFPDISTTWENPDTKRKAKKVKRKRDRKLKVKPEEEVKMIEEGSCSYRDRAAERRNLHGGYGVGPGQKGSLDADEHDTVSEEDTTAEALEFSFGSGSYARKIMGNMGWKEGETLGKNTKGLVEPIQAVGNTGNAGLGFPQRRRK